MRRRWLLLVSLAVLLPGVYLPTVAQAGREGLTLVAECGPRIYGLGHPISVLVRITNNGQREYRDIAPLAYGWLDVELARQGHTLRRPESPPFVVVSREGYRLKPGESMREVVTLMDVYGGEATVFAGSDSAVTLGQLRPGDYTARVKFRTRLGWLKDLPQESLTSDVFHFHITDSPQLGEEDAGALLWLARIEKDRSLSGFTAAEKLEAVRASAGSGLFPVVWGRLRLNEADLPLREVIRTLAQAAQGDVMLARIANQRCVLHKGKGVDRRRWLEQSLAEPDLAPARCILETWRRRLPRR